MTSALLALILTGPPQGTALAIAQAGWLAGCWTMTTGPSRAASRERRTVTEYWLGPDGGTMMGLSRTVSGGKTVEYEFLLIREGAGVLEYVAKPSGQAEAVFTSTSIGPSEIVFENPSHDFPTRISYRKQDGGLLATVSGTVNGKPRSIDFKYMPGSCPK